ISWLIEYMGAFLARVEAAAPTMGIALGKKTLTRTVLVSEKNFGTRSDDQHTWDKTWPDLLEKLFGHRFGHDSVNEFFPFEGDEAIGNTLGGGVDEPRLIHERWSTCDIGHITEQLVNRSSRYGPIEGNYALHGRPGQKVCFPLV